MCIINGKCYINLRDCFDFQKQTPMDSSRAESVWKKLNSQTLLLGAGKELRLAEVWKGVLVPVPHPGTPALSSTAPPPTFLSHHETLLHRSHLTEQLLQLLTAGRRREAAHKQGQPSHEAGKQRRKSTSKHGRARETRSWL